MKKTANFISLLTLLLLSLSLTSCVEIVNKEPDYYYDIIGTWEMEVDYYGEPWTQEEYIRFNRDGFCEKLSIWFTLDGRLIDSEYDWFQWDLYGDYLTIDGVTYRISNISYSSMVLNYGRESRLLRRCHPGDMDQYLRY